MGIASRLATIGFRLTTMRSRVATIFLARNSLFLNGNADQWGNDGLRDFQQNNEMTAFFADNA